MTKRLQGMLLICTGLLWTCVSAFGQDHEQDLAERLLDNLEDAWPVWLQVNERDFLGLYRPGYGRLPRRGVVLVHGMGGHPDWPDVIRPLRTRLPGHGWSTLSLQMPVLPAGAPVDQYGVTVPEAVRRIVAGVDYLRDRDYASIFIIGYSFGAAEALSYMAEEPDADGVVTIGVQAWEFLQPQVELIALIGRISRPVLDVYGGRDFTEVIRSAQDRRQAAHSAGNTEFRQAVVEGADHYFTGHEEELTRIILDWLNRYPAGFGSPAPIEMTNDYCGTCHR